MGPNTIPTDVTPTTISVPVVAPTGPVPDHLNPLLRCHGCGAYCALAESILSGRCCECRGDPHKGRW